MRRAERSSFSVNRGHGMRCMRMRKVFDSGDMGADTGEEVLVMQDMVASELWFIL